ncbi:response regulator [Herbaspirillum robiniae]|uniref:DNA-binding response regulator n=2 Tax=Herbaspirillum TaxID=963 RepID=A0A2D0B6X6_9BURK|nr:response regulator transcription factor [Herbaspirillum robiniae]KAF1035347.1 MAG: Oxygen regulatory protein NreC [Herbaspirillum frisingense]NUU03506.1 response regulator transcription factor [Herbaspirillum robiniae]OWY30065.1 DNA-binding response regulator [Herbaspirillum robiniae]
MLTRIMLADDHALVRSGIKALLAAMPGVEVVGEASDGAEVIEMIPQLKPDLVVMDIAMKGMNGLEALRRLRGDYPTTRFLMLSMYGSEEYVMQALNAGANGYLFKDSAATELEKALYEVKHGRQYLDSHISREALDNYMKRVAQNGTPVEVLTPRQREILQLIAEGNNTKEIAYQLNVSAKTIETHRAQLMERLDIRDVPGLVRYAIRTGIATPDK